MSKPQKVVQLWTQTVDNMHQTEFQNRWGFGDLLRGTNNLYSICKELSIDFDLDYRYHPIHRILLNKDDGISKKSSSPLNFINFKSKKDLKNYLIRSNEIKIELVTNGYGAWNLSHINSFRNFIHPKLLLNEFRQLEAEKRLPVPKTYKVIHVRMGDDHLIGGGNEIDSKTLDLISNNLDRDTYLITDSPALKRYVQNTISVKTLSEYPVHLGLSNSVESIFNTYLEFMLMAGATEIKTLSVYSWVSGFAMAASMTFDVPLKNIKTNSSFGMLKDLLGVISRKI